MVYVNSKVYVSVLNQPLILRCRTIKRLLQPGAATSDILQQYVSTIKVLRYLDPPGVLLYGVAEPIRRYLRLIWVCYRPEMWVY